MSQPGSRDSSHVMPKHATSVLQRAAQIHKKIAAFDSHIDVPLRAESTGASLESTDFGKFNVDAALQSGLSGAALTLHATLARRSDQSVREGLSELESRYEKVIGLTRKAHSKAALVRSPTEFRQATDDGQFAVVLSFQNASPLGSDLNQIDFWAGRGVSMFAFAFIGNNIWSDSSRPYPFIGESLRWNGLSDLGKAGIRRLNDLGLIIDVSQLSKQALDNVLQLTRAPIVASHSAVRALVDTDRNLSNDELHKIKANGGVVQIAAFDPYLRTPDDAKLDVLRKLWSKYGLSEPESLSDLLSINDPKTAEWEEGKFWEFLHLFHEIIDLGHPSATTQDFVDAIDYAVELIGVNHVGIGSDFNHGGGLSNWSSVSETVNVTAELIERGYSDPEIAKIWGGNFMRVWEGVIGCRKN